MKRVVAGIVRSPVVVPAVMIDEGVAFAVLLGLDGSPPWRVARVVVTLMLTALAVWYARRVGRNGQGATVLVLGIAGMAAGGGVGGAHLANAGLDAAAVLAGIVLVTGVFLVILGAAALVRAIPGWWRLLAIPAALGVLWFVLYPLTIAVIATNRPAGPLGTATPVGYGLVCRNVAFRAADDTAAAVSFLTRQPGVRPGKIAVLGESMGGEQALATMGTDPRIRAVVAEGVTGQQLADKGWLPHGIDGVLERGMEWVEYTTAGLLSGAPRPMSIPAAVRAAAPGPALIIAGAVNPDEPMAARWFQAASPATVHVWVVPRAGAHSGSGHRPPGPGSPRDQLPEHDPAPGRHYRPASA
jgi:hypothetical protein